VHLLIHSFVTLDCLLPDGVPGMLFSRRSFGHLMAIGIGDLSTLLMLVERGLLPSGVLSLLTFTNHIKIQMCKDCATSLPCTPPP
jgi:hypothetical protein